MSQPQVPPVLVTGATGRVGRMVVDQLLAAGVPVRAFTRQSVSDAGLPPAAEIFTGDFASPSSLDEALRGAGSVFLVWTAPPTTLEPVLERIAAHTRRVIFLSSPHQTPHPFFAQPNPMAAMHAEIERLIAASGLESVILRPGMFASNSLFWWAPAIQAGAPVRWPYGGAETAPVDDRDVAAVAAHVLSSRDGGGDHVLTGPEALSQAEQVRIIADVLGRPVPFEELSPAQFRKENESTWPPPVLDMLLEAWDATTGTPAYVTTAVADILGRPARSYRQWVTDHAAAFTGGPPAGD